MGRDDAALAQCLTWRHAARDLAVGLKAMAMVPFVRGASSQVPCGDGHPVLLLPGFMTSDIFMRPMHQFLRRVGYRSYRWRLGVNRGYSDAYDMEALIARRMQQVLVQSGQQKLTLVGWSLGGIYAKALAQQHPDLVRDVITLGSPLAGDISTLSLFPLYERVTGIRDSGMDLQLRLHALAPPLPHVPLLSVYSRNDGLVPVQNALQQEGPLLQNVHVQASHLAMPYDPFVHCLIAHRLAQSRAAVWQPLDVTALQQRFDPRMQST